MEEAVRYTSFAVAALFCALLLKKAEPTVASLIALAAAVGIGLAAVTAVSLVADSVRALESELQTAEGVVSIFLKMIGIVWVTAFGAQVCRDCGEGALGMQLEQLGGVLALVQALPLLSTVAALLRSFF